MTAVNQLEVALIPSDSLNSKRNDVPWIDGIPSNWTVMRIKNSCILNGRIGWQGLKSSEFVDEGPYVITGVDFENGKINWKTCKHFSKTRFDEDPSIHVKEGDLLITKDGTIGKVAIAINTPSEVSLNSGVMIIRPQIDLNRNYLRYVLLSRVFWNWYESTQRGNSTIRHLYQEQFYNFKYPMPPLEEQRSIVKRLDDEIPIIERAIDTINEFVRKIDEIIKSRFIEMFGDPFINPKQWKRTRLSNYIQFITSGSRDWKQFFSDEGDLFLTITNVKDCKICLDNVQHVHPPNNLEAERTRVQSGDLLISITADLGRTGVVTEEIETRCAYINQHLTCIRLDQNELNPLYVAYLMESPYGKEQFGMKNKQSVKAGLNFDDIRSLQVLVPPKMLQDGFVSFVEQVDKSKLELQAISEQLTVKLNELKQSLIYELVTGKTLVPEGV